MAITLRTRKILWIKAGGRCSKCRVLLVTEGTDSDDPSVFGEEAHIVGKARGGPRAGKVTDVDAYDNLILLCSKDHKQVDDQVGYYTVHRLKVMNKDMRNGFRLSAIRMWHWRSQGGYSRNRCLPCRQIILFRAPACTPCITLVIIQLTRRLFRQIAELQRGPSM
jgi:hypothetical protein